MKTQIKKYTFNTVDRTITFLEYNSIDLDGILLITNVSTNTIIYNFANPLLGGSVINNVLTLNYNTSGMNNLDKLQIFYENPARQAASDELADAIFELVARLDFLAAVRGVAADLRMTLLSGTLTTLTTLSNQTSIGGYNAAGLIASNDNLLVSLSNINNITK